MVRSLRAVVRVVAFVAAGVAAFLAPAPARAYPWPLKPFHRPHAIRGAFDDPRLGGTFHFGVDIVAASGQAVYAVAPGTVFRYSDAVAVRQPDGHEFSYWHVRATVPQHSYVKEGTQIGVVRHGFGHVHFAEWNGHTYLNPLRRGALAPFVDRTRPVVGPIDVEQQANGTFDATVQAYDPPPMRLHGAWRDAVWTPEVVRWRLVSNGLPVVPWTVAADFDAYLPRRRFRQVYAPGTRQNLPGRAGRYVFRLMHGLGLADGRYALEVLASDTRGNTGSSSFGFDVTDQSLNTTKSASR
jgi:Peptidase family M23